MAKSHLKLVTPATEKRTVTPKRRPNVDLRTREYLTEAEVDYLIADRHAAAKRLGRITPPEHAEGQILNREIRTGGVGGFHPASRVGIVGFVEDRLHGGRNDSYKRCKVRKSSTGSMNEQDPNEIANLSRAAAMLRKLRR